MDKKINKKVYYDLKDPNDKKEYFKQLFGRRKKKFALKHPEAIEIQHPDDLYVIFERNYKVLKEFNTFRKNTFARVLSRKDEQFPLEIIKSIQKFSLVPGILRVFLKKLNSLMANYETITLIYDFFIHMVKQEWRASKFSPVNRSNLLIPDDLALENTQNLDDPEKEEENPTYDEEFPEDSLFIKNRETIQRDWFYRLLNVTAVETTLKLYNRWVTRHTPTFENILKGSRIRIFKYIPFFRLSKGFRYNYYQYHEEIKREMQDYLEKADVFATQLDAFEDGEVATITFHENSDSILLNSLHQYYDEARESAHFRNAVLNDRVVGSPAELFLFLKYIVKPTFLFDHRFASFFLSTIYKYITNQIRVRLVFLGDWYSFYIIEKPFRKFAWFNYAVMKGIKFRAYLEMKQQKFFVKPLLRTIKKLKTIIKR